MKGTDTTMRKTTTIEGDRSPLWTRDETFIIDHNNATRNNKTNFRNEINFKETIVTDEYNDVPRQDRHVPEDARVKDELETERKVDDFINTPNLPSRPRASTIGSDYRREILQRTNKRFKSIKKYTQIPVLKRNSWRSRSTSHATNPGPEISRADEMSSYSSKSRRHSSHYVNLDTADNCDSKDDDNNDDETFCDDKAQGVLRIKRKHLRRRILSDPAELDDSKDSLPVSMREQTSCESFYNKTAEKVIERYRKRANSDITELSAATQHFKDIYSSNHDHESSDIVYLKHNLPRKLRPLFPERPETKPGFHEDMPHVEIKNTSLNSSSDDISPINTCNKNYSAGNEPKANLETEIALRTNLPASNSRKALIPLKGYTPNILDKIEREKTPLIMDHGLVRKGSGHHTTAIEPLRRVNSEKARPISSRHGNLSRDRPASVKDKKHPRSIEQLKQCSAEEMEKLKTGKEPSRQGSIKSRKSLDRANSLPDSEAGADDSQLSEMMSQLKTCRYLRTNTDLTEET
ncbi:unnamed protein product [Owenia fusiformis]|uniref:Uncharacterized protein n=1 Tax=Owenia fusiformis TaxID=6347 RepID=A0A8J1TB61_OWEFU|nr:unnamed protein product [Owenia fusiformis]